jgi:Cys-tRNA(Pro)/Cys-tRNA(Cys) deacylase
MAATRAIDVLERAGVEYTVHSYVLAGESELSYGEAVAAELGADPQRVFKTLVAAVDGEPVVAVVPVAGELSLKALAKLRAGKKARMADPTDARRLTGYVVGGISPFGHRKRLPVVVDSAARRQETVFVSGGKRGLQVEVKPADLIRLTGARVAPIAG